MRLCRLTGERYTHALARYGDALGIDLTNVTEQELVTVLARIESERNQILSKVRAFEQQRVQDKQRGNRRLAKEDAATFQALRDPTGLAPDPARPREPVPRKNRWSAEQWRRFAVALVAWAGIFFLGAIVVLMCRFLGIIRPEEQSWVIPFVTGGCGLILGTIILVFKGR